MESITYINRRTGKKEVESVSAEKIIKYLYHTQLGQATLHTLVKRRMLTKLVGKMMDSKLSRRHAVNFARKYRIKMSDYIKEDIRSYATFNDFFTRKIKMEKRPVGNGVVSPADGKILAFQNLSDVSKFFIKGSEFTLNSFLDDDQLAKTYKDGAMLIVRLAPSDYHRFHFPANGVISESKSINGRYYSVSPLALRKSLEIFCQNYREYSILQTEQYDDILISEIGASMVGSISQTYKAGSTIKCSDEKGYFSFGGSTVVLLFKKGSVTIDEDLCRNTQEGYETSIHVGESVAK